MTDESWKEYSNALKRLCQRPSLRARFDEDMDGSDTADLNISEEMRADLKRVLLTHFSGSAQGTAVDSADEDDDKIAKSALSAETFFQSTWAHLRRGALVTTLMSVIVFLVGLMLLVMAAVESITDEEPGTAIVLAASGMAAIAAAFYRSPVTEIRQSTAEAQQSSMVLMSYMLGLSLLSKSLSGKQTSQESTMLTSLTRDLVTLLRGEDFASKMPTQDPREHA